MELPINYDQATAYTRKKAREAYVKLQGGLCHYCGEPLTGPPPEDVTRKKVNQSLFPPSFFQWPVHLHHHHTTGMTIGAVHNRCNAVLWQYYGE
jgi:hypothetical protein